MDPKGEIAPVRERKSKKSAPPPLDLPTAVQEPAPAKAFESRPLAASGSHKRLPERATQDSSPVPRAVPEMKPKKVKDEDEYDDDFEDYDEDFEEEEEEPAPQPKKPIPKLSLAVAATKEDNEMKALRQSMQAENMVAMEKKQSREDRVSPPTSKSFAPKISPPTISTTPTAVSAAAPESTKSKRVKKFGSIEIAASASSQHGPRAIRLRALREQNILEMNTESFLQLNILPCSTYEHYQRKLFTSDATIKQVAVPAEATSRDVDMNTDVIEKVDKEMQFCYDDDTALLQTMEAIRKKRLSRDVVLPASVTTTIPDDNETTTTLATFLQRTGGLMEAILTDLTPVADTERNTGMWSSNWIYCGSDAASGSIELLRTRAVQGVCVGTLQGMIGAFHKYDPNDEEDLRPYKGLLSIWSISNPASPALLLQCSDQPTSMCFSCAQAYIVVGGTDSGSIHLWDMREPNSIHRDRDALDLHIVKGIREPTFSSNSPLATVAGVGSRDIDADQHDCPIAQIEAIGASSAGPHVASSSQFLSLDISNKVILWMTSASTDTFETSPWGQIQLIKTRVMVNSTMLCLNSVVGVIPNDASMFFLSSTNGTLKRITRHQTSTEIYSREVLDVFSSSYQCNVTAVHVNNDMMKLILVGREDGSVDLFRYDWLTPIQSYVHTESPVVMVQWISSSVFVVVNAAGDIYMYDLLQSGDKPLYTENCRVDVSRDSVRLSVHGNNVHIVIADSDKKLESGQALKIRKIAYRPPAQQRSDNNTRSFVQEATWASRSVPCVVSDSVVFENSNKFMK